MKGVVFDFGNVLYRVDYAAMAKAMAGDRAQALLEAFVGSPLQVAYETGRACLDDVLHDMRRLGFPADRNRFLDAYLSVFSPVPGVRPILECLSRRRPLGLLSNTSPEHARLFIERTPEFPFFCAHAYSFELGAMKPASRTYDAIACRLGLASRQLAYVDDVAAYSLAAESSGMVGIVFRGAPDLARRLVGLGFRELEPLGA